MDPTKDKTNKQPVVSENPGVVPPVSSTGGVYSKETEPHSQDFISPSEKAPEISEELREIGVEEGSDAKDLVLGNQEITRVSDRQSEPVAIIPTPSSFRSPLSQEEMIVAKKSRISDAIAWLANTITRQIKRSKFNERKPLQKPV